MATVEVRLLVATTSLDLGDLHALSGAEPDQIGLELGHHREHVEQEPPDGVGRVVDRPAQVQLTCRAVSSSAIARASGRDRARGSSLVTTKGVARTTRCERFAQAGTLPVGAGEPVVDVDAVDGHAEPGQTLTLSGEILLVGGTSGVPNEQRAHGVPPCRRPARAGPGYRRRQ